MLLYVHRNRRQKGRSVACVFIVFPLVRSVLVATLSTFRARVTLTKTEKPAGAAGTQTLFTICLEPVRITRKQDVPPIISRVFAKGGNSVMLV